MRRAVVPLAVVALLACAHLGCCSAAADAGLAGPDAAASAAAQRAGLSRRLLQQEGTDLAEVAVQQPGAAAGAADAARVGTATAEQLVQQAVAEVAAKLQAEEQQQQQQQAVRAELQQAGGGAQQALAQDLPRPQEAGAGAAEAQQQLEQQQEEQQQEQQQLEQAQAQQMEQQQARQRQPGDLLSFENDPVPEQAPIFSWRRPDPPLELSSSAFLTGNATAPGYVAACLVIRDQHGDILEWVAHHLRLGISKIYVFDNGSDPPLQSMLQAYIDKGMVVYTHFTTFQHHSDRPQLYAYDRCLQDYGPQHHWMVFIDADEFLIFRDGPPVQSLPDFLAPYEQYSGVGVHWILFGSSGYTSRPSRGVLRSYYKCLPLMHSQHTLIKTIANTRCTTGAWGPHAFHHNCSRPVVRTNLEPIEGPRAERPVFDRLVLHHYATKSLEEFKDKMARGSGMRRQRGMEYFWFVDAWSVEYNFDALRIWDDWTDGFVALPAGAAAEGRYASLPVHEWNAK